MLLIKAAKHFNVSISKACEVLELNGFPSVKNPMSILSEVEILYLDRYFGKDKSENINLDNIKIDNNLKRDIDRFESEFSQQDLIQIINENLKVLNQRSKNILIYQILPLIEENRVKTINLVDQYFYLSLRNCGRKTSGELLNFFNTIYSGKLKPLKTEYEELENKYLVNPKFNSVNIIDLISIHRYSLSKRAQNGLFQIEAIVLNDPYSIFKYTDPKNVISLENIGKKTSYEIANIILKVILNFEVDLEGNSINRYKKLFNDLNIETTDFIEEDNLIDVSYYKIFELFFFKNSNKSRYFVVDEFLKGRSYGNISKNIGLSKERIRQIVNNYDCEFEKLVNTFIEIIANCGIDFNKSIEEGLEIGAINIADKYEIKLHSKFIEKLIDPKFNIINAKNKIDGKLDSYLFIDKLVNNIINLNKRVKEDFKLSFNGLLLNFLKNDSYYDLINIYEKELKDLIYNKTGLLTNTDGELVFLKNVKSNRYQIVYDIIEQNGNPMHVEDISKVCGLNIENIRAIVIKEKRLFINTAFSTYGLKKWDDDGRIKGGTIIELIIGFLKSKPEPSHIYQIFKYIKSYRNTSERSIEGLIKSDTQKRFLKFGSAFYGVEGFHNDYKFQNFKSLPGVWHFHLYKDYVGIKVNSEQFIKLERRKWLSNELIIKANLEKRIDFGDIQVDEDGLLVFKKFVLSHKRGRPRRID